MRFRQWLYDWWLHKRARFMLRFVNRNMFGSTWSAMGRFQDAPLGTTEVIATEALGSPDLVRLFYLVSGELFTVDTLRHVDWSLVGPVYFRTPCSPGQNGQFVFAEMDGPQRTAR